MNQSLFFPSLQFMGFEPRLGLAPCSSAQIEAVFADVGNGDGHASYQSTNKI